MGLVGGLLAVGRAFAHVLHRQRAGDDQHLVEAAQARGLQQHAPQARVDGNARQLATQGADAAFAVHRRQFLQQVETVADRLAVRRLDKGEIRDVAQAQVQHLQDHRRQVGAQDLRIGEFRPAEEILLAVQADADTRLDAATAALALVGAGLRHRLDGQALHLGAIAVAADARGAGIDHVADARHGQRGFRHVGGQHDLAPGGGLEDLLLLGRGQPRIQRQHLGEAQVGLAQHLGGVADLALAGQEHQHVAGALADALLVGLDLGQRGEDALIDRQVVLDPVAVLVGLGGQRAVPGFHRVGAPGDFDDRRVIEMLAEALQVDGRRGDDDLQVRAARQQLLQVAEQEVDVQRALVGLVDDQRVVLFQEAVVLGFRQQDAVGHQLDQGALGALVLEAHLVADQLAQRRGQFLGDPGRHAARRQPARLGMADQAVHAPADLQADLRQLGGLARAGLAGDDQYLMLLQRRLDLVALGGNRQRVVVTNAWHALPPRLHLGAAGLEALQPLRQPRVIGLLLQLVQLTTQAVTVGGKRLIEVVQQGGNGRQGVGHLAVAGISERARLSQIFHARARHARCAAVTLATFDDPGEQQWTIP